VGRATYYGELGRAWKFESDTEFHATALGLVAEACQTKGIAAQ